MHTKRIIPCLDVRGGRVVKGVNFVNLKDAGDPVEIASAYVPMLTIKRGQMNWSFWISPHLLTPGQPWWIWSGAWRRRFLSLLQ